MKILFVANVADLYGASRSLLRLATQLSTDGHGVEVVLPQDGPLRGKLEQVGVRTVIEHELAVVTRKRLRASRGWVELVRRFVRSTVRLVAHIRSAKPDVVHTNAAVVLSSGLAARICGVPHIWHVREFLADVSRAWLVYQWFMALCSSVILCNSQAVASQFHGLIRKRKVRVVYNGIPAHEVISLPVEDVEDLRRKHRLIGRPIAGVVGRIHLDQKGQDVFVKAAALVAHSHPEALFVVAGSAFPGNEEHQRRLDCLIEERGLAGRVRLTGDIGNPAALFAILDICVLPAVKPEGLGNVLIEAMATGKAVIGTRLGGVPEIIEHGKSGFLVEPNDHKGLAAALAQLLEDDDLRSRMGEEGRRRYQRLFEFSGCYRRVLEVYSSLAERASLIEQRPPGAASDLDCIGNRHECISPPPV